MTLLAELEDFVRDHSPHGALTGNAAAPAWNGYLVTVACSCGVVFSRWVTPLDVELDLLRAASLQCRRLLRRPGISCAASDRQRVAARKSLT